MSNFTDGNTCYARLYRKKEDDYTEPVQLFLSSAAPNLYSLTADDPADAPAAAAVTAATSGATSRKRLRPDCVYCCATSPSEPSHCSFT